MDKKAFKKLIKNLKSRIATTEKFVERAHREGISSMEALTMQNHLRTNFSPHRRASIRKQIKRLNYDGRITTDQMVQIEALLDRATRMADEHFLKLAKIVLKNEISLLKKTYPGQSEEYWKKLKDKLDDQIEYAREKRSRYGG
jgi:hypothetical protein